ncbi:unnamed protein product [Zymoseptoria tritici ST99CH_3D1]|nr:unnamed protein product [Zymoseptoria tritici ST99CH_3D1]
METVSYVPKDTPWPLLTGSYYSTSPPLTGHFSTSPLFEDAPGFPQPPEPKRERKPESPTMMSSPLPGFFKQLETLKGNVGRLSQTYSVSDFNSPATHSPRTSMTGTLTRSSTTFSSAPSSPPSSFVAELDSSPLEARSLSQPPASRAPKQKSPLSRRKRGESIFRQEESPEQIAALWKQYVDCVQPLLKFVDTSTVQHLFYTYGRGAKAVAPDAEALRSAICFAAASSLRRPSSNSSYPCPISDSLLQTHAQGVETHLAEARFMSVPTVMTLQALTIYLTCGRQFLESTYIWSMTAVLVRLATKLKLHKDPETQGLPFADREYRRRLWWHICTLDTLTASESNCTDPMIYERQCTTRFPEWSTDPNCATYLRDMFYSIVRFEITYYSRTVLFSDEFTQDNTYPLLPTSGKLSIIDSLSHILEEKYFRRSVDQSSSSYTLTVMSAKISTAELKLAVLKAPYDAPSSSPSSSTSLTAQCPAYNPSETSHLLSACVDILEALRFLRSDPSLSPFSWLWHSPADWRSAATCLIVLAAHHRSVTASSSSGSFLGYSASVTSSVNRAWLAIDSFFDAWKDSHREPARQEEWMRLNHLRSEAEEAKTQAAEATKEHENKKTLRKLEKRRQSAPYTPYSETPTEGLEEPVISEAVAAPMRVSSPMQVTIPSKATDRRSSEDNKKAYRLSSAMTPMVDFRRSVTCLDVLAPNDNNTSTPIKPTPIRPKLEPRPATSSGQSHRPSPLSTSIPPVPHSTTNPPTPATANRDSTASSGSDTTPPLPRSSTGLSAIDTTPRIVSNPSSPFVPYRASAAPSVPPKTPTTPKTGPRYYSASETSRRASMPNNGAMTLAEALNSTNPTTNPVPGTMGLTTTVTAGSSKDNNNNSNDSKEKEKDKDSKKEKRKSRRHSIWQPFLPAEKSFSLLPPPKTGTGTTARKDNEELHFGEKGWGGFEF